MTSQKNKVCGVRAGHFNDSLFGKIAKVCKMVLHSWKPLPKGNPSSNGEEDAPTFFISNLLKTDDKEEDKKFTGVHFFEICGVSTTEKNESPLKRMKLAIKILADPEDINEALIRMHLSVFDVPEVEMRRILDTQGYPHDYLKQDREIKFIEWATRDKKARKIVPQMFSTESNEEEGVFLLAMEYLEPSDMLVMDTLGSAPWTQEMRLQVLKEIAEFHAAYLGKIGPETKGLEFLLTTEPSNKGNEEYWQLNISASKLNYPHIFNQKRAEFLRRVIDIIDSEVLSFLQAQPYTIIHSDFHTGNLCYRESPSEDQCHLCAYDWEIVSAGLPQKDVTMFLMSSLPVSDTPSAHEELWDMYMEYYRKCLSDELKKLGRRNEEKVEAFLQEDNFRKVTKCTIIIVLLEWILCCGGMPQEYVLSNFEEMAENIWKYTDCFQDEFDLV